MLSLKKLKIQKQCDEEIHAVYVSVVLAVYRNGSQMLLNIVTILQIGTNNKGKLKIYIYIRLSNFIKSCYMKIALYGGLSQFLYTVLRIPRYKSVEFNEKY